MKKLLLSAFALLSLGFSASAIDWTDENNLMRSDGVTIVASSVREGGTNQVNNKNNGDLGCSTLRINENITVKDGDEEKSYTIKENWFIFDLGSSKEFSTFEFFWRDNHPAKYSIYISDNAFEYQTVTNLNSPTSNSDINTLSFDISPLAPIHKGEINDGGHYNEVVDLKESYKAQFILIYTDEPNGSASTYGTGLHEIYLGNFEDLEKIVAVSIPEIKAVEGSTEEIEVTLLNGANVPVESFKDVESIFLSCSNPEAVTIEEIEKGKFNLTSKTPGTFALNVEVTLKDGTIITGSFPYISTINWEKTHNIISSEMTVFGRINKDSENPNPPSYAIDNNSDTYYRNNDSGESWVFVDLGAEYIINAIESQMGDGSTGSYKIGYAPDGATIPTANLNEDWKDDNKFAGWSSTETIKRNSNDISSFVFTNPVIARYISLRDTDCPGGAKPQYKEIMVAGTEFKESIPTEIVLEASSYFISANESVTFTATVYDQNNVIMNIPEGFSYTINSDPLDVETSSFTTQISETRGTYRVSVDYETLNDNCIITVAGDEGNNLTNSINHLIKYDGVVVENRTMSNSIGQESTIDLLNHTLTIELQEKVVDLDLIKIKWEAACPSDYTVDVIYNDNERNEVFSISGRRYVNGVHPIDRIYVEEKYNSVKRRVANADDLSNIKAIEIKPTARLGHDYELKLWGVELYGTEGGNIGTSVNSISSEQNVVSVYSLQGILVKENVNLNEVADGLAPGIYIVNGKKVVIK